MSWEFVCIILLLAITAILGSRISIAHKRIDLLNERIEKLVRPFLEQARKEG